MSDQPTTTAPAWVATWLRKADHGFDFEMPDGRTVRLSGDEVMHAPWWSLLPEDDRAHVQWHHNHWISNGWAPCYG